MAGRNTYKEDEILETPFDFKHLLRASVYVKKYAKKIQTKNRANERVEVIEMDELYSFVERKKPNLRNDISK